MSWRDALPNRAGLVWMVAVAALSSLLTAMLVDRTTLDSPEAIAAAAAAARAARGDNGADDDADADGTPTRSRGARRGAPGDEGTGAGSDAGVPGADAPEGSGAATGAQQGAERGGRGGAAGGGAAAGGATTFPDGQYGFSRKTLDAMTPAEKKRLDELAHQGMTYSGLKRENERLTQRLRTASDERAETELTPEEQAERGQLRFHLNDVALRDQPLSGELQQELGLSDTQAGGIEDILRQSADNLQQQLVGLYSDMTGDPQTASSLSLSSLVDGIRDLSPPDEFAAAVRQISAERAGTATPGEAGTGSYAEQMLRAILGQEDWTDGQLSTLLGPELAAQVQGHDEWKGIDHSYEVGEATSPEDEE